MTADLILGLIVFAFASSVTPGPNNMMLLASGVNFGFRRTLPHMLGVGLGFVLMVFLIGVGLGQVFDAYPMAYRVLKYAGIAYILWLAWKIAGAGHLNDAAAPARPLTFLEAAAFQWVNPKGWMMAASAVTNYAIPGRPLLSATLAAGAFGLAGMPSISLWPLFGTAMRRFLDKPGRLRAFNIAMAVLLVLSLAPVLWM